MIDSVLKDLRFAARCLWTAPAFTTTAITLLALTIGALTTVFSAIDAALLLPMSNVSNPDAIVWITSESRLRAQPGGISYPELQALTATPGVAKQIAAYESRAVN